MFEQCFANSRPVPSHLNVYVVPTNASTGLWAGHCARQQSVWLNYQWLDGANAFNPLAFGGTPLFPGTAEQAGKRYGTLTHEVGHALGLPSAWKRACVDPAHAVAVSDTEIVTINDVPSAARPNYIATLEQQPTNDLYSFDVQALSELPILPASAGAPFSCGFPTQFMNAMDLTFEHRFMFSAKQMQILKARARTLFPALPPPRTATGVSPPFPPHTPVYASTTSTLATNVYSVEEVVVDSEQPGRTLGANALQVAKFNGSTEVGVQFQVASSKPLAMDGGAVGIGDVVRLRRSSDGQFAGFVELVPGEGERLTWNQSSSTAVRLVVEAAWPTAGSVDPIAQSNTLVRFRRFDTQRYMSIQDTGTVDGQPGEVVFDPDVANARLFYVKPAPNVTPQAPIVGELGAPLTLNARTPVLATNAHRYTLTLETSFVLPSDNAQSELVQSTAASGPMVVSADSSGQALVTCLARTPGSDLSFQLFSDNVPQSRVHFGSDVDSDFSTGSAVFRLSDADDTPSRTVRR